MTPRLAGTSIGPYRVVRPIGAGGWSTVYEVVDGGGRAWALKLLRDDLDDAAVARFHREVASLGRIANPGVVRLVDAGVDGRSPYLVTPLLAGPTLRAVLAAGPVMPEVALALVIAAAHAVGAIHAAGLVHRDLKPDNLVLTTDGAVVAIDLGLALGPEHSRHTTEDTLTGSVPYMAPEQIEDRAATPAGDVWSLAVVLFEALAGRRPFQRRRGSEEVAAILAGRPPDLIELAPAVGEPLAALVARCLSADPARRPRDGAALARALEAQLDGVAPTDLAAARARWLADPVGFTAAVAARRAAELAAAAAAALAAGDRFAATRLVERGLAYRPDDAALVGVLDRVMGAGGRAPAATIRGAAPAPSVRRAAPAAVVLPTAVPSVAPVVRRRRRWRYGAALAVVFAVGVLVARPWRRGTGTGAAGPRPPAAGPGVDASTASTAGPPRLGDSRPAHVQMSRPAERRP
ncbi:MAG: protein kinase [Kofleriaceae bacterium]